MRQFYFATTSHSGGEADGTDGDGAGVCEPGFHFASLWEILGTSGLRCNTTFGKTRADSGHGPPPGVPVHGWVCTGNYRSDGANRGEGNCQAWNCSSGA